MRTTVIPAQITTVEDKIAGNLNLTQFMLLLAPVFLSTFIYAVLPERLHFSPYKIALIAFSFITFLTLSLRIKERVILNWIVVFLSYGLRPRQYLFNKNDLFMRDIVPIESLKPRVKVHKKAVKKTSSPSDDLEKVGIHISVKNPKLNFRFNRKGALVVQAYE